MKPKIVSSDEVEVVRRKNPATLMVESLEGEYKTMRDMAERYGVHMETMRRVCRSMDAEGLQKVKAPSHAMKQGGLVIYLFDDADVAELDAHMEDRGYKIVETK